MHWFTILAVITGALALGLPPAPQMIHQLHTSSLAYRFAVLALLVPYGVIWYAAFYAFSQLREYSQKIKDSEDGRAFRSVTAGMGVLAFGLVLPTTISLVLQNIASHYPAFKPASVIIDNYTGLAVAVIAFIYINNGSHALIRLGKNYFSLAGIRIFALLYITLATVFTHLVVSNHYEKNAYHLTTPLLFLTFIIPALFSWFVALLSAYEFGTYAKHIKGVLYHGALRQFAYGIAITIVGSIVTQFVANTFEATTGKSLGALVLVDYALLAIYVVGLVLMALGTKKLKKIEEV